MDTPSSQEAYVVTDKQTTSVGNSPMDTPPPIEAYVVTDKQTTSVGNSPMDTPPPIEAYVVTDKQTTSVGNSPMDTPPPKEAYVATDKQKPSVLTNRYPIVPEQLAAGPFGFFCGVKGHQESEGILPTEAHAHIHYIDYIHVCPNAMQEKFRMLSPGKASSHT